MRFTTSILPLLLAISGQHSASALPNPGIFRRVPDNEQACTATDQGLFASYSVNIGIHYNDGLGCNNVLDALKDEGVAVSNWQCVDDGGGNTQLWFNAGKNGEIINTALERM